MRAVDTSFLQSRVARRIFLLFLLAVLVPVGATLAVSLYQLSSLLTEQTQEHLQSATRAYGQGVYGRLSRMDAQLKEIAEVSDTGEFKVDEFSAALRDYFDSIFLVTDQTLQTLFVKQGAHQANEKELIEYIKQDSLILEYMNPNATPQLYLLHRFNSAEGNPVMLAALMNENYLRDNAEDYAEDTGFCVSNARQVLLFCTSSDIKSVASSLAGSEQMDSFSGNAKWQYEGEDYLGSYWHLFLRGRFGNSDWLIQAIQPASVALQDVALFKYTLICAMLLSIVMVAFLSVTQIRRVLVPIEHLMEGVQLFSRRKFDHRVMVSSRDEFEELSGSLNFMADRLSRQFTAMSTLSGIDRIILSTFQVTPVVNVLLQSIHQFLPSGYAAITLINSGNMQNSQLYVRDNNNDQHSYTYEIHLTPEQKAQMQNGVKIIHVSRETGGHEYLFKHAPAGINHFYLMPIIHKNLLTGALILGDAQPRKFEEDEALLMRDLSDRLAVVFNSAEREEQLFHQAHYDELTGLANRRLFTQRMQQEMAYAERKGQVMALMFLDLDRFKHINDGLGHAAGDDLLKLTAKRLKSIVRKTDVIARLGGDEFTVLLPDIGDFINVCETASKIVKCFEQPFDIGGNKHFVSASVGVTVFPDDGNDVEVLLKNADAAMYRAKETGRGSYVFYTEEMNQTAAGRVLLEKDLRHALDQGEFELFYQPQIHLHTGEVFGGEALIRWHHSERGFVSPGEFIPLAEEIGFMPKLGAWVLREACTQYMRWHNDGVAPSRVAVNVAADQFTEAGFVDFVRQTLEQTGLSANCLELELTEGLMANNSSDIQATFSALNDMGVRLAIDDFGTGYSSLSYLKDFPMQVLKIDRSFIIDVCNDNYSASIADTILVMARALDKEVVAEGVEDEGQLEFLRERNCDVVQGFIYSKPLPADEFAEFVKSRCWLDDPLNEQETMQDAG